MYLTAKQRDFVNAYLALPADPHSKDGQLSAPRAVSAATAAGYAVPASAAGRLMQRGKVVAEIERVQRQGVALLSDEDRGAIDAQEIIERMIQLMNADIRNVMTVKDQIVTIQDSEAWSDTAARSIDEISQTLNANGTPKSLRISKVKYLDVLKTLGQYTELLGASEASMRIEKLLERAGLDQSGLRELGSALCAHRRELAKGLGDA